MCYCCNCVWTVVYFILYFLHCHLDLIVAYINTKINAVTVTNNQSVSSASISLYKVIPVLYDSLWSSSSLPELLKQPNFPLVKVSGSVKVWDVKVPGQGEGWSACGVTCVLCVLESN